MVALSPADTAREDGDCVITISAQAHRVTAMKKICLLKESRVMDAASLRGAVQIL